MLIDNVEPTKASAHCEQEANANASVQQNHIVKLLAAKVISMVSDEVNKTETQVLIKQKVITPVINMIYAELYPYIIALIVTIITIFVLSLLTFISFVVYYLKNL